jgi:hypothetical protein
MILPSVTAAAGVMALPRLLIGGGFVSKELPEFLSRPFVRASNSQ